MLAELHIIDWIIILGYLIFCLGIGMYYSQAATKSTTSFFVAGKNVSWWMLGTSMVATTFASDTPLAVSGLVVQQGIMGNWYWWCTAMTGMFGVFFISRLWRRSEVITDTEFSELRYGGKPAAILRGFRALYFGIIYNSIVMGWVNLAMAKLISTMFNIPKWQAVGMCFVITVIYTALSGLWGVMATDFVQFIMAMFGSISLAVISVGKMGGIQEILRKLSSVYGQQRAAEMVSFAPNFKSSLYPFSFFLIAILLQWWATGNTDGGGYIAQRMFSAKNEKHSLLGYLWFNIAHYCLRPWPWIVVGLVAAVKYPYLPDAAGKMPDAELGYIKVMLKFLPTGLLGIMVASFTAAYMSTIDTHINWGASYLVNDFYKRFLVRNAKEKHYVLISIFATILIAAVGAGTTLMMNSIMGAWKLLTAINSGIGLIYLLRWLWWRINAWSELSTMLTSLTVTFIITKIFPIYSSHHIISKLLPYTQFPLNLLILIPSALFVCFIVTLLTAPVKEDKLMEFYKKVKPGGAGWRRISSKVKEVEMSKKDAAFTKLNLINWIVGVASIYSALLGIGKVILGDWMMGVTLVIASLIGGLIINLNLSVNNDK